MNTRQTLIKQALHAASNLETPLKNHPDIHDASTWELTSILAMDGAYQVLMNIHEQLSKGSLK